MTESFPIIPSSSGPVWLTLILVAFVGGVTAFFCSFAWSARRATFDVSPAGLRINASVYGRTIALADIETDGARAIDLTQDTDLTPVARTNGAGLPGYLCGWFRLRNGLKALLFVTDRRRVAYVPTRKGYAALLSTPEPDRLVGALRRAPGREG